MILRKGLAGEHTSTLQIIEHDCPGSDLFLVSSLAFTVPYNHKEKKGSFVSKIQVRVKIAAKRVKSILEPLPFNIPHEAIEKHLVIYNLIRDNCICQKTENTGALGGSEV